MDNLNAVLIAGGAIIGSIVGLDLYTEKKYNDRVNEFTNDCIRKISMVEADDLRNVYFEPRIERCIVQTRENISDTNKQLLISGVKLAGKRYNSGHSGYRNDMDIINDMFCEQSKSNRTYIYQRRKPQFGD